MENEQIEIQDNASKESEDAIQGEQQVPMERKVRDR